VKVSRHRRSSRAGVSWPNDDEHHAAGEDKQTGQLAGPPMVQSIIACVPLVRALARQAAREAYEAQVAAHSETIQ
jgi:hypothetical protein